MNVGPSVTLAPFVKLTNPEIQFLKLSFGHGLTNAIGFNISWKAIGLGYESRWTSASYQSLDKEIFGKTKYKFKAPAN